MRHRVEASLPLPVLLMLYNRVTDRMNWMSQSLAHRERLERIALRLESQSKWLLAIRLARETVGEA